MMQSNGRAAGRGDGDEPMKCQVCSEALVEGRFSALLGYWMMCDDCVAEVAAQVMEVFQRRLLTSTVEEHVVLNKDMDPVAILDDDDLESLRADKKGHHGAAVYSIR